MIGSNPNRRIRRQGKLAQEPPEAVRAYTGSSDSTAALPRQDLTTEQQQQRLPAARLAGSRGGQGAAGVSGMRQQTAGEAAPLAARHWPSKESADASGYTVRRPDFGDDRSSEAASQQSKRASEPDAFETESAGWQFIRPNATQNASSYAGGLGGEFTTAGERRDSAASLQQSSGQLPGGQRGADLRQSDDNNPHAAQVRSCGCHVQISALSLSRHYLCNPLYKCAPIAFEAAARSATENVPWLRMNLPFGCIQAAAGNQFVSELPADLLGRAPADLGISDHGLSQSQGFSQSQQGRTNVQISRSKTQPRNLNRKAASPAEAAGQAIPAQIDWSKNKATGTDHLPVSEQQWRERQAYIVKACKVNLQTCPLSSSFQGSLDSLFG